MKIQIDKESLERILSYIVEYNLLNVVSPTFFINIIWYYGILVERAGIN